MVFNMRSSKRSPPLVATCGAACAAVGSARGQNFHSIDYKLLGGKHLMFISAQIDNNMGAVEIVDEAIIALLTPEPRQAPGFVKTDDAHYAASSRGRELRVNNLTDIWGSN